jgi:spore coat polysaccharide biosynthesis protein SpsF
MGTDSHEWRWRVLGANAGSVPKVETVAFVQARMGSTRLPGKVLESLAGQPALLRIADRLNRVPGLETIAVLTSELAADDEIAAVCEYAGITCVRGPEDDVLGRFQLAAERLSPERVVRITADCPLVDPHVVSELIELHAAGADLAYASVATGAIGPDAGYRRFPDGLDAEVFDATALAEASRESRDPFEREHATPFIWRRPQRFPAAVLECETDHGDERWTVDFPEDLAFVRAVYERLGDEPFGWHEVLALLDREPDLRWLNQHHRMAAD